MRQTLIKKALYAITTLTVAGALYSFQPAASKYTLTGQFSALADGTKMELLPAGTHKNEKPIAETVVKNGKFVFTGSVASPRIFAVKIAGEDFSRFRVMVENADIHVTGKVEEK